MIWILLYLKFVVALAWFNSYLIKRGKKIHHWINGLLHFGVAVVLFVHEGWQFGLATLFSVKAVFDLALNKFRGLDWGYVPVKPQSWIDKKEKWLIFWIVAKMTDKLIVNNEVKKVSVWLKISYLVCALLLVL